MNSWRTTVLSSSPRVSAPDHLFSLRTIYGSRYAKRAEMLGGTIPPSSANTEDQNVEVSFACFSVGKYSSSCPSARRYDTYRTAAYRFVVR